jgi:hypothetical protein
MLTLGGKLYKAPIGEDRPLKRCLDAGTGTGVWAMDFGKRVFFAPCVVLFAEMT